MENKKLIAFDLDGTLTLSKADLDPEMAELLRELLQKKLVAVMGGAAFSQFQKQFIDKLGASSEELKNLLMFPTSSASFYRYDGESWNKIYENFLSSDDESKIRAAFSQALAEIKYVVPTKTHGEVIENRGAQITFSAIGQSAPLLEKQKWHDTQDRRSEIKAKLDKMLPEFNIHLGGLTSIDVTKRGIDKAYGIAQIEKLLKISKEDMIFAGDALYVGGNDYPVKRTGVETVQVNGPGDTEKFIKSILM